MRSVMHAAAATACFAAAAVVHTFPLATHLTGWLPGDGYGDNLSFVWNLWWMRVAVSSPHEYFYTPALMAPHGASLVLHSHAALASAAGATLLGGIDVVAAQNALVLASVTLNGVAAWALARAVTGSSTASLLAGVLFMLSPPLAARLMGHFNLLMAWTFVFGSLAVVRLARSPALLRALLLGLTAACTLYADYYLFVMLIVFAAVYCAAELWTVRIAARRFRLNRVAVVLLLASVACFAVAVGIVVGGGLEFAALGTRVSAGRPLNPSTAGWLLLIGAGIAAWRPAVTAARRGVPARPLLTHLSLAVVVCVVLAAPLIEGGARLIVRGDYVTQGASLKSSPPGADVGTLLLGPPFHGRVGPRITRLYGALGIDRVEQSAWLGILPLALAFLGAGAAPAHVDRKRWLLVGATFLVWSLGPYLQVMGSNVGLLLPQAIARVIPILNNARIPGRALIVVSLSLAVLAAIGVAGSRRLQRRSAVLVLCAIALLELGVAPLPLTRMPDAGAIEAYLASESGDGAVLYVPFGLRDGFGERGSLDHAILYLQSAHGRPLTGGFLARLPRRVWNWYERTEPFSSLLVLSEGRQPAALPSCAAAVVGLRSASVRFVVLDRRAPPAAAAFVSTLPLDPALETATRRLLVLSDRAACR